MKHKLIGKPVDVLLFSANEAEELMAGPPSDHTTSLAYLSNVKTIIPTCYGQLPGSIGVLESLDRSMPIGEVHCLTWDENGLAVRRSGSESKRYLADGSIVDRQFRPTQ